jgi:lysozyme
MKAKKEESEGNVNTKKELEKVKENIFARAKRWPIISTFYHLGGAFKKLFTGDFGGFFKELGLSALNTIIPGFDIIAKLMSDTKEERDDVKSDKTGANLKKLRESVIYRLKTTPLIGSFVSLGSSLWNFLTLDFKQGFKDLAHAGLSFPGVGLLMSLFEDDEELEKVKVEKKTFNDIIKGLLVKLKDKFANAISKMPVIGGWVANNIFGSNFKDELDEKSNVSSKDIYKRLKDQGIIDRNLFGSDTIEDDKQLSNLSQQELNELIKTDRFKNKELEKIKTELAKQKEKNTKKTITKDDLKIPAFSEGGELPPGVSIIGEGKSGPISKSAEFVHTDRTGKSTVIPQDKSQEILKDKNITRDNLDQKSTIISQDKSQEILKDKNIENVIDRVNKSKFSSGGYWMNLFEKTIDQIFNFAGIDNLSTNFISRFKIPLTKEKQKEFNKYKDQFISEGLPEKKAIKKAINKLSEENPEYIDSYSEILKKNIKNKSTISNNDFQIDVDNLSSLITTRNSMKEFISLQNKGIKSKSINQTTSNKDIFNNWKNELTYDGNKFYELNKTINDKYNHHLLLNLLKTEFKNREWLSDSPDMKSRDYALILNDVNKNWKRQNLDLPEKINKQEINMIDRFRSEDENFKYIVRNRYPLLMDKADRYNELYLEFLQSKKENIPHQEALKVLREEDPKYFERYENSLREEIGILNTDKYGIIQDVKQERAEKRAVEKFIESEYLKKINDKPNDVQYSPIQIDKNKTIERKDSEKKNVKLTDAEKKVLTENHNKINTLTTSQVQSFNNKIDNSTSEHIDSNGHKTHDRIANIIRTGVDNIESNRLNNDNIDDLIQKHIIFHEGVVLKKYVDTEGYPTIGIGHKIKSNEEFPNKISYDKAISLFEDDYDKHKRETQKLSVYSKLDPIRKGALTDMVYNMGYGTVKNFKNMLNALSNKDYDKAQEEALDSKWATQVGNRANKISKLLKTGDPKWFSSGEPQVIAKTGAYYTGEGTGTLRAELHPREMVINDTQFDTFLKNMADSISEHIKSLSNTKDYKTSKIINRATEVNRIEEDNKIQELEMEKNRQNTKTDVEQKAPIYIDNSSTNTGQNVLATKQDDKKPAAGEFTEIDSSLDRLVLNLFDKTQILTRQIEGYVFNNEQPLSIY